MTFFRLEVSNFSIPEGVMPLQVNLVGGRAKKYTLVLYFKAFFVAFTLIVLLIHLTGLSIALATPFSYWMRPRLNKLLALCSIIFV